MSQQHIAGIDGLRALAVLAVMVFHLHGPALVGGFVGVDVFFVISGYVVARSLISQPAARLGPFLMAFYARRVVRIYPALLVCVVLTAALQSRWVPASWLNATADKTALAAIFGAGNLALVWFNDGYFSPRVEFNAFTHTWSLGVEEQFYLLFPLFCWAWTRGDTAGQRWTRLAWVSLLACTAASLMLAIHQTIASPTQAYYLLPARFWELSCGALLMWAHQTGRLLPRTDLGRNGCVLLGVLLIGASAALADANAFPIPWALMPTAGCALALAGLGGKPSAPTRWTVWLQGPALTLTGRLSYSLYLWHWPVLVLLRWTIGLDQGWQKLVAALATATLAAASYYGIELGAKRLLAQRPRSAGRTVAWGAMAAAACTLACGALFALQPWITASVTGNRHAWYTERPLTFNPGPSDLRQTPGERTLFVLGDSHAGAYGTLLNQLAKEQRIRVVVWSQAGCSVANLVQAATASCKVFIEQALGRIEAMAQADDLVLLASLRVNRLGDQWGAFSEAQLALAQQGATALQARSKALDEAHAIVDQLERASLRVIMDAPKPVFRAPAFRCADTFNQSNPVCSPGLQVERAQLLSWRQPTMAALRQLQAMHPRLVVWDTFDQLCPGAQCQAMVQGQPWFFDGDHLSAHANRMLYRDFLALVQRLDQAALPNIRNGAPS